MKTGEEAISACGRATDNREVALSRRFQREYKLTVRVAHVESCEVHTSGLTGCDYVAQLIDEFINIGHLVLIFAHRKVELFGIKFELEGTVAFDRDYYRGDELVICARTEFLDVALGDEAFYLGLNTRLECDRDTATFLLRRDKRCLEFCADNVVVGLADTSE